jgi:hypothetical protein
MKTIFSFSLGLDFYEVMDLTQDELDNFLRFSSREEIIGWLQWNDPNGVYTDDLSLLEFDNILLKEEAIEIMKRQIIC